MGPDQSISKIEILVKQVAVKGNGAVLLTGPSSCGKGEIANALSLFLSLPSENHISMGDILRRTVQAARRDASMRQILKTRCKISDEISVLDPQHNTEDLIAKVNRYIQSDPSLKAQGLTQLDWFDYCVHSGLLIPDAWTECLIESHFRNATNLHNAIFILDGYPRTPKAAKSLLDLFDDLKIPVIKVLHLSITKAEMKSRALGRGRSDDTDEILERRYDFYVEHVQPCIDYLKSRLGKENVALIDAHQPAYDSNGNLDVKKSIQAVTASVLEALGLPRYLLDLENERYRFIQRN